LNQSAVVIHVKAAFCPLSKLTWHFFASELTFAQPFYYRIRGYA
jgi:hypothetical protein